jgi:hypothetical protein
VNVNIRTVLKANGDRNTTTIVSPARASHEVGVCIGELRLDCIDHQMIDMVCISAIVDLDFIEHRDSPYLVLISL